MRDHFVPRLNLCIRLCNSLADNLTSYSVENQCFNTFIHTDLTFNGYITHLRDLTIILGDIRDTLTDSAFNEISFKIVLAVEKHIENYTSAISIVNAYIPTNKGYKIKEIEYD